MPKLKSERRGVVMRELCGKKEVSPRHVIADVGRKFVAGAPRKRSAPRGGISENMGSSM